MADIALSAPGARHLSRVKSHPTPSVIIEGPCTRGRRLASRKSTWAHVREALSETPAREATAAAVAGAFVFVAPAPVMASAPDTATAPAPIVDHVLASAAVTAAEAPIPYEGASAATSITRQAPNTPAADPSRVLPSASTGDPREIAENKLKQRGWGNQFQCLDKLWDKESGWKPGAWNPSGAGGIPQAKPAEKMGLGKDRADWSRNPDGQIDWGLSYIATTYGTPCKAWDRWQAQGGWY